MLLTIDTSGVDCAVGLFDMGSGKLIASLSETIGKGHAERLMSMVDEALSEVRCPISEIARIAVTIGPGSFTGIRVGVAAARGFSLALSKPAIGVSTLEVLAASHSSAQPGSRVMAAIDARREEIYVQVFSALGAPLSEPCALTPHEANNLAKRFDATIIGSGRFPIMEITSPDPHGDHFALETISRIGASRLYDGQRPKPLYIRSSGAKIQSGFAIPRA